MSDRSYWSGWPFTPLGERPESGQALRNYQTRERRYRLQLRVMEIILKWAPALAYGDQDLTVNDDIIQAILQEVEEKQAGYALKHSRNFFVQGLDKGKRHGLWHVNIPAPVCTVRRKPALFQPANFARLPNIRRIDAALQNTFNDPSFYICGEPYATRIQTLKDLDAERCHKLLRAGQLLASAIRYGGLLDAKSVYLLPSHITKFTATEDFLWVDLMTSVLVPLEIGEIRSPDEKRKRFREERTLYKRWFPDAITELLLLRWMQDDLGEFPEMPAHPRQMEKYCDDLWRLFMVAAGVESADQCSLKEFTNGATTGCALEIPALLLNYAQGKHRTSSLPAEVEK